MMRGSRRKATRVFGPGATAQTASDGEVARATASAGTSTANRPSPPARACTRTGGEPSPGGVSAAYDSSTPDRRPSTGGAASASQMSASVTGLPASSTTTPLMGIGFGSGDGGSWARPDVSANKAKTTAFMRIDSYVVCLAVKTVSAEGLLIRARSPIPSRIRST